MAQESCNLDKDEAEILKPSSSPPSSSSSSSPSTSLPSSQPPSSLLLNPPLQEPKNSRPKRSPEPFLSSSVDANGLPPSGKFGNRCSSCRKKVGLTGFRCRCGDLFCGRHRYSDTHNCSFDYKAVGREAISKANPVIRASKIIKI